MIVVCVGLPKTGTKSFVVALNKLGLKSCHYPFNVERKILQGFEGFAENDSILNYKTIYERYPNSKFVLLKRPMKSWLNSLKNHFEFKNPDPKKKTIAVRKKTLGASEWNKKKHIKKYKTHHKEVRQFFKGSKRYMEMSIKDGWEPLCKFLGKKIPKEEFPHKNKGRSK